MNVSRWTIEYYHDERGRYPVRDFIDSLDRIMRSNVDWTLDLLETRGDRLGMPYSRPVSGHRFIELRVSASGNIVRVFYFAAIGRRLILLHAFEKKTQKIPIRELQIADRRREEFSRRSQ